MFLGDFRGLNYLSLTLRYQNIKWSRSSSLALTRWSPYNYNILFISDSDVYLKSDTPILHHNQVTI